jgi:outer membrane protein TolC
MNSSCSAGGPIAATTLTLLLTPWGAASASEIEDLLRATLDHPSVNARTEESRAAEQELAAVTRRYFGRGGLNAEAARYEDQRFIGVLSPTTLADPPFDRSAFRYGIAYSVPIDLFGAIAAARQAAQSNLEAARLTERQQVLLKLHDATSAYVQLQALRRQEAALASQRQRVTATVERVRREVQVQLAAGVDLKLAESEMARITSDEVRLRGSVNEARAALEEATGKAVSVADLPMHIPSWPSAMSVERALPVLLAQAQATTSRAQAQEAHRSLLPAIAAVGDYSEFDVVGAPDAWSVGARFMVPLDASAYRRASALDARARAATRREAATAGELTRQWDQLKAAYDSAVADTAAVGQEVIARREVVDVQVELQRVGITSMEDLLRQQRDLVDSESRQAAGQARAIIAWSAGQVLLGTDSESYIAQLSE